MPGDGVRPTRPRQEGAAQAAYVRARVAARGLRDGVEVQHRHYRDIEAGQFDAVSTIERGAHVGDAEYPAFTALLHSRLRPRGRVLVQQMSRGPQAPAAAPSSRPVSPPDMHMRPLGETSACSKAPAWRCGT
jgi:cyclopropane-fatty-acyl-phospholipid synthase